MKPGSFALIAISVIAGSCKKDNAATSVQIAEDKGCIEWKKVSVTDHSGQRKKQNLL